MAMVKSFSRDGDAAEAAPHWMGQWRKERINKSKIVLDGMVYYY